MFTFVEKWVPQARRLKAAGDLFIETIAYLDRRNHSDIILGEAAKNIPPVVRERYLKVPWRKIAGLRDISVHKYSGLDEEIRWDILQRRILPILDQIDEILADEPLGD
jgi:hypothetical protein